MKNRLYLLFLLSMLPAPAAQQTILLTPGGTTLPQGATMINANFTELYARAFDSDITLWAGITPAAGISSALSNPTSANWGSALTDETGIGVAVFATSPTLVTPNLGTPSTLVGTNITGTATGLTAGISNALKSATTTVSVAAATAPTVGQVLTATSGTAATWQDATGGSGSIATDTLWDAAGDLTYGTGANTAARLAPGTAGQILTMNGGATAPAWSSTLSATSIATSGAVTAGSLEFEGATADAFETALAVVDPTADRTITFPNATGTVILDGDLGVGTQTALSATANAPGGVVTVGQAVDCWVIAISDETTALTTGTAKVTFRTPYGCTITGVRASLTTDSSSGIPTFDINENGTTIMAVTKLTVDATEKTSSTAATAAVVSDTTLGFDTEITIDIDVAGTGAAGAKIYISHIH